MPTIVRKLLDLLSPRSRVQLAILMSLIMGTAVLEAVGVASIMPFVALVISPERIHTNEWLSLIYDRLHFTSDKSFLTFAGVVVLVLLVLTNAAKATSSWATMRYQYRELYELRRRLLASYMMRPYKFFLARNSSELTSTAVGEASGVIDSVMRPSIDVVAGMMVCSFILLVLVVIDPLAAGLIVAVLGGAYVTIFLMVRRKLSALGGQQIHGTAQMFRSIWEAMGGIKDLKLLGREATFLDRFVHFARIVSRTFAMSNLTAQLPRFALEVIAFGGMLIVILYQINMGKEASQVIPIVGVYAFAGYRLLPALHSLFGALTVIKANAGKLHLVHHELNSSPTPPATAELELRRKSSIPAAEFRHALELQGVIFQYETAKEPSLKGLSLRITPGALIGLVGPTGCGKTTTVDLILGLLIPDSGRILLDGVEITTEDQRTAWQKAVGYVPQSIYISDDTIARNIAFGVPDAEIDMAAVRRAAVVANLAEFIETSLPEGYEAQIGERGVRLSGGQRQRIGIARAMYRDPAVLVMDEATSALDGITEEAVMDAVHKLSKQKTIILIAHRLTTVRDCDVIYQLDRGAIVAQGTYDELMRESAWFRGAARGLE